MEYTCQNHPKEKEITIVLEQYDLVVISGNNSRTIPYAEITEIRLNKKKNLYLIQIITLDYGTVLVTSQSFGKKGERIDQSRLYLTFTRILHMHLIEKSNAIYFSGVSLNRLLLFLGTWLVVTILFYITDDYLQFVPGDPLLLASLIFLIGASVLGARVTRWPRSYKPTEIPLHMLPSAT